MGGRSESAYETVHLKVRIGTCDGRLPVLGPLMRSMLISDPPIRCVEIRPECCLHYFDGMRAMMKGGPDYLRPKGLVVESGITCGDLLLAAERAHYSHRHCRRARPSHRDKASNVVPHIEFRTEFRIPAGGCVKGGLGEHLGGWMFYQERYYDDD
jgi:hypothetical protein